MAKILLYCYDIVGPSMAGPAIRYWEFAQALSQKHEVVLLTPTESGLTSDKFQVKCHHHTIQRELFEGMDVLIAQLFPTKMAFWARYLGLRMILDAYDPMPLENLEIFKYRKLADRYHHHNQMLATFDFSFKMADGIICANRQQRHLWLGLLLSQGRITPDLYDLDPYMERFVATVPFGLSSSPLSGTKGLLRKRFGLDENVKILLWGGGIWNWFDPLSLIRAIALLRQKRNDIVLVFMGLKHPNPDIPEMKMALDAVELAKELKLLDSAVYFNYGWIPYQERSAFLLDADIGVSMHNKHIETEFSFRTRLLDYIWAELPIVATDGDSFADLIRNKGLGTVVPYGDSQAIAEAIEEIIDQPKVAHSMKAALRKLKPEYYWESIVTPINTMIEAWQKVTKPSLSFKSFLSMIKVIYVKRGPKAILQAAKARLQRG